MALSTDINLLLVIYSRSKESLFYVAIEYSTKWTRDVRTRKDPQAFLSFREECRMPMLVAIYAGIVHFIFLHLTGNVFSDVKPQPKLLPCRPSPKLADANSIRLWWVWSLTELDNRFNLTNNFCDCECGRKSADAKNLKISTSAHSWTFLSVGSDSQTVPTAKKRQIIHELE